MPTVTVLLLLFSCLCIAPQLLGRFHSSRSAGVAAASKLSYFSGAVFHPNEFKVADPARKAWLDAWKAITYNYLINIQRERTARVSPNAAADHSSKSGNDPRPLHFVFLGDSTLRLQKNFLCQVLDPNFKGDLFQIVQSKYSPLTCSNADLNVRVTFTNDSCIDTPSQAGRASDPDEGTVFVFNGGLHLLHLGRARPFECLDAFFEFEDRLKWVIEKHQALSQEQLSVFVTVPWICVDKFTKLYGDVLKEWEVDRTGATVQQCINGITGGPDKPPPPGLKWKPEQLKVACADGLFNGHASSKLNKRALAFLREYARDAPPDRRVHVLDVFPLTYGQCWATKYTDGRHYPGLVPVQILKLLELVQRRFGGGSTTSVNNVLDSLKDDDEAGEGNNKEVDSRVDSRASGGDGKVETS